MDGWDDEVVPTVEERASFAMDQLAGAEQVWSDGTRVAFDSSLRCSGDGDLLDSAESVVVDWDIMSVVWTMSTHLLVNVLLFRTSAGSVVRVGLSCSVEFQTAALSRAVAFCFSTMILRACHNR